MLKLKWLEFEAIGRFVEKQRIDFTTLGNLTQVDGINTNTDGSSGSGKTTIFQALEYLLGMNSRPASVLQSRLTKTPMTVSGGFDFDGKELVISRGKKLTVELNGEVTTGSKLAEEKIDQIIGMPRDLFRKMLHKRQKEGGFFLKMTPGDTHDFLIDCLGLSDLRKKIEKLDIKIAWIKARLDLAKSDLNSATASLSSFQVAKTSLEGQKPIREVTDEQILQLKNAYDAHLSLLEDLKKRHKNAIAELEAQKPALKKAEYDSTLLREHENNCGDINAQKSLIQAQEIQRQNEVKSQISKLKLEHSALGQVVEAAKRAKLDATEKAAQVKKIRDCTCPTCEQSWITESAKVKETSLMNEILSLKEIIVKGQAAEEKRAELTAQIETLVPTASPRPIEYLAALEENLAKSMAIIVKCKAEEKALHDAVFQENSQAMAAYSYSLARLTKAHSEELNRHQQESNTAKTEFDSVMMKQNSFEALSKNWEESLQSIQKNESQSAEKFQKAQSQVNQYTKKLLVAEELKRAIKTFTSRSFEDALSSIGDTATRIIRNLPNMANSTITLEATKETKDGKVKEEVNAVLSSDGEERVPFKSLSGGEESSADLAVDLAVIDFVENRANKGIDIFILDEPFTGMDTVIIEQALEVLKSANLNKKLIIVDHNPIIKEQVTNRILVRREGEISEIVEN